jgi:outer membrane protein OmpU
MKKLLLCTTALVSLAASSAFAGAEGMKVEFSGMSKFTGANLSQDSDHKGNYSFSPNQKSTTFFTKSKVALKAEGTADDLTYGAVFRLKLVTNSSNSASDTRADRSHIYLDTNAGSVHLGSNASVSSFLQRDASTIASATGGIDGDYSDFANTSVLKTNLTDAQAKTLDGKKDLLSDFSITGVDTLANRYDDGESARKISYLSPRIENVQLGVSFTPDMRNTGVKDNEAERNGSSAKYFAGQVNVRNLWSLGLNYKNTFNDVTVDFSVVADKGTSNRQQDIYSINGNTYTSAKFNDLQTYSVGGIVSTNGFSLAASYHNDGKSLTAKEGTDASGKTSVLPKLHSDWWTVGLGYENGPMSTSLTYLSGQKKYNGSNIGNDTDIVKVKSQIVSLGVDYEVVPGLTPFAEVTMATYKPNKETTTISKSKSTVFMIGTKLKF